MQYKNKKNLHKILFIVILLGFIISFVGCDWLSLGLLNIFDPQAQIRVNYTEINIGDGIITLEVYSLNRVEFIGEGFSYDYYIGTTKIPELSKTVGATFYVEPSDTPGIPGPITIIDNLPIYFQEVQDYLTLNPLITEITCTINLIGTDGSGNSITKPVTFDLPALQPGIDFEPPTAVINVTPGTTGIAPFTVVFDASDSADDDDDGEIASYSWDFGDETTGTNIIENHTYDNSGLYFVTLTVTDFFGNEGSATVTITVNEPEAPTAIITTVPDPPTGIASLEVYFDAYDSHVDSDCGFECEIVSYKWNFGDGSPSGTGVSINHTFDIAGTYVATLTVTDSNGKEGYDTVTIIVNEPEAPTAIITTTPKPPTGSVPFTVAFDASDSTVSEEVSSCCSIVNWSWDFGDGDTGTGIITTHLYDTVGLYPVVLAVTDSNGKVGYATIVITATSEEEPGIDIITVSANPESNVPGGTSTISAIVTNTEGDIVADGTTVYFYTNSGELSVDYAVTANGIAKVTLTLGASMQEGDIATVTAFIGAVTGNVNVTCIAGLITEEVTLSANPESNVPGGSSTITAIVTKKAGGFVDDGTIVYFITNSGSLSPGSSTTIDGVATVELTLDDNMEAGANAKVTAFTVNSEDAYVTVTCIEPIVTIYAADYSPGPGDATTITAVVTETDGTPVSDNTVVIFFTSKGTFTGVETTVEGLTTNGSAKAYLTLAAVGDIATVTAKSGSSISNEITLTCTAD